MLYDYRMQELTFGATLLGFSITFGLAILIVLALVLAFEIWMFVDAIRNPNISNDRKLLWLVGMLLLHPFVAIIYFFTDHNHLKND